MQKILIDSGPLIALFDADDKHHKKAVNFVRENKLPLVTTLASITETLHLLDFNRNAQKETCWRIHGMGSPDHHLPQLQ